jgi:hypothetical protein
MDFVDLMDFVGSEVLICPDSRADTFHEVDEIHEVGRLNSIPTVILKRYDTVRIADRDF